MTVIGKILSYRKRGDDDDDDDDGYDDRGRASMIDMSYEK